MFEPSNEIFQNKEVLTNDYDPKSIQGREEEIKEYKSYLQPVVNGNQPHNILLYGKNGVGKTATTQYLLHHLEKDAQQYGIDVTTIYLNCETFSSSYQVTAALVNELRDSSNNISRTGHPEDAVYNFLWDELDRIGGPILIVLDDVDYIGTDSSILYQISRARAHGKLNDAKPGIIGICNSLHFYDNLDPSVQDSLRPRQLEFPPYDANQLAKILSSRAQSAFVDADVISNEVIPLCSALAAQNHGSAREALDLLLESGDLARRQNDETVERSHVYEAEELLEKQKTEEAIRNLPRKDQLVLCTVCELTIKEPESVPVPKQRLHNWYQKFLDPDEEEYEISLRTLHRYLRGLVNESLLHQHNRNHGPNGGSYYEYELAVSVATVLVGLEDCEMIPDSNIANLRKLAKKKEII